VPVKGRSSPARAFSLAGGCRGASHPITRTSESTGARCDLHARTPMGNKQEAGRHWSAPGTFDLPSVAQLRNAAGPERPYDLGPLPPSLTG
jgi:hypothetical protein